MIVMKCGLKELGGELSFFGVFRNVCRVIFGFPNDWEVPLKFNGEGPEMLILLRGAG